MAAAGIPGFPLVVVDRPYAGPAAAYLLPSKLRCGAGCLFLVCSQRMTTVLATLLKQS